MHYDKTRIVLRQRVAQTIIGQIEWKSKIEGFCQCPGEALHTTESGSKHCRVTLDKVPTIFCLHSSCVEAVAESNHQLRSAIGTTENGGKVKIKQRKLSPEEVRHNEEKEAAARLEARAAASLTDIIQGWAWNPQDAASESPFASEAVEQDWSLLLSLYQPKDTLWIGADVRESGAPENLRNFRTVSTWLQEGSCPGVFICPAIFKPGIYSRSQENIVERRFLVIESDTLTKEAVCAVFRWSQQFMRLRAIVDTAGKSLHGWFDYPPENILQELKIILPALGCDPALFRPAQPCRLPGAKRGGKLQSLVWFGGGH